MKDPIIMDGLLCEYAEAVVPGVYRVSYPHPNLKYNVCTDYYKERSRAQIAAFALIKAGITDTLDIDRLAEDGRWIPVDRW